MGCRCRGPAGRGSKRLTYRTRDMVAPWGAAIGQPKWAGRNPRRQLSGGADRLCTTSTGYTPTPSLTLKGRPGGCRISAQGFLRNAIKPPLPKPHPRRTRPNILGTASTIPPLLPESPQQPLERPTSHPTIPNAQPQPSISPTQPPKGTAPPPLSPHFLPNPPTPPPRSQPSKPTPLPQRTTSPL